MALVRRFFMRLLSHLRFSHAEHELRREIDAHLRLLEDGFLAQGMSADEARAAARRAFGGVEQVKEHQRDVRSFRWLTGWSMDLRLGVRMLVKYPGLTCIAVIALAVAIGAGAAYMEFVTDLANPTMPFENGERVVGIVNWDVVSGAPDRRALHDFSQWRRGLRSVEDLGAAALMERNLITSDGRSEPVSGVEISASAFRVMPIAPLLGRPLLEDDERADAAAVAVIGEEVWRSRFGEDPSVLGQRVRLGRAEYTVVGVMPRTFGFPVNQSLWAPLRANGDDVARRQGPDVRIFGRLRDGATLEQAQAELTTMAASMEPQAPDGTPALRPVIKPYVASIWSTIEDGDLQRLVLYSANLVFLALLGICGANVATLVFARTVTREGEITVRTALGASRARIASQLFAEALVLTSLAAVAGLAIASFAGRWGKAKFIEAERSRPPFWWSDQLSPETFLYATLLAIVAALVVGIVPAWKATGAQMQSRLKSAGTAGPAMKFGGVWTAVIVGQVAVTIVFLMMVVSVAWNATASPYASGNFAFRPDDYVTLQLEIDRDNTRQTSPEAAEADNRARLDAAYREMERRLEVEPAVAGVTHTTRLPGGGAQFILEMDPGQMALPPREADNPLWVRNAFVGADFFDTFQAPIVSGRGFTAGDAEGSRKVAIVDQTFVRTLLGGRDPVGLRIRERSESEKDAPGPWLEIIGVVRDLGLRPMKRSEDAMLYRPATPGGTPYRIDVAVHARGQDIASLAAAIGRIAAEVDPTLRLRDVMSLSDYYQVERIGFGFLLRGLAIVSAVALLLSTAGIYALTSFTLSRRTREIGIRMALGAAPPRIIRAIFSRAFGQIGAGILAGCVPGYLLVALGAPEIARGGGGTVGAAATAAIAVFISAVAALACALPARRALRIHPTEALRAE